MNKRNVNLDRFHTACASVRPTGPSISDRNIIMSIKEHYAMLEAAAEIATPKQEKYEYLYDNMGNQNNQNSRYHIS